MKKFTLKEKYAYHKDIADTGKMPDGTRVGLTTRIRHANSAIKVHNRLDRFMHIASICGKKKK